LLAEMFLLDPENAATISRVCLGSEDPATEQALATAMKEPSAIVDGKLPPFGYAPWEQPWAPMYLLWEVDYYPIPHDASGKPAWTFDGTSYAWSGSGASTSPLSFDGRSLLTPQAVFNLQAQIARYEAQHPEPDLQAIADFVAQSDKWDLLSQTLDGLGSQLALRDPRARRMPGEPVAALVGDAGRRAPVPGVSQASWGQWPPSSFQQMRGGQLVFDRVTVVDRFGQALEVVSTSESARFAPVVAPPLQPAQGTVIPQSPARFVQLTPRLLQAARLRFDLVSAWDDTEVTNENVGANPICGWVLPNHLDGSLLVFDPAGAPLGELSCVTDSTGHTVPWWTATPGSAYSSVASLQSAFPSLFALVSHFTGEPAATGAADLRALQATIDETLALIEPLGGATNGSLAVLAGRPLALVRARAAIELDGAPVGDPSWRYAMQPQTPEFASYPIPVRLGDLGRLGDGLVGFFQATDYDRFNAVHVAGPPGAYVAAIGPGNFVELTPTGAPVYLTMLLDPRAPVHATTDFLPVSTLRLPTSLIRGPLAALAPTFRLGPVLTTTRATATDPPAFVLPLPAQRGGTWSWQGYDGTGWTASEVVAADAVARLPATPAVRDGYLKLGGSESEI
jgi:hypothetical protein